MQASKAPITSTRNPWWSISFLELKLKKIFFLSDFWWSIMMSNFCWVVPFQLLPPRRIFFRTSCCLEDWNANGGLPQSPRYFQPPIGHHGDFTASPTTQLGRCPAALSAKLWFIGGQPSGRRFPLHDHYGYLCVSPSSGASPGSSPTPAASPTSSAQWPHSAAPPTTATTNSWWQKEESWVYLTITVFNLWEKSAKMVSKSI